MLTTTAFALTNNIPFSVFGDSAFILLQNLIIIGQMWTIGTRTKLPEKILLTCAATLYTSFLSLGSFYSMRTWSILLSMSAFLNVSSKVPQILKNIKKQSTGQLSLASYRINWIAALARVGTVMYSDLPLMERN